MLAWIIDPSKDPKVELIVQLLDRLGYIVSRVNSAAFLKAAPELRTPGDHLIVVPDTANDLLPFPAVVQAANAVSGSAFLVYVTNSIQPEDYKTLVRTGAADWVGWDSALSEIRELSRRRRALQTRAIDDAPANAHTVTTFFGACGGVGTTTLALETGIYLAGRKGRQARSVAVVDLEPQDSIICDYADLAPRVDLAELARDPERLDDYLLDIFTTRHQSGLHIFACDNQRIDISTLDQAAVFTLLNRLVEKYQIVIVDGGSHWSPWIDGVLAHSDKVFVVSRYTIPSVKKLIGRMNAMRDMGIAASTAAAVITHCSTDLFGRHTRRKDVDALFAQCESHYVAADVELATECVDAGESVVSSGRRSAIVRDIRKLADVILEVAPRSN